MKVVMLGSTGLVGSFCVRQLLVLPEVEQVLSFSRRTLDLQDPKLIEQVHPEFDFAKLLEGMSFDAAVCCFGTTIKQAGSREAFEAIDLEIPLAFARAVREHGVKSFHHVSSIGASKLSGNFYLRTKGRLEEQLGKIGFESLHLYRPALLLGLRHEKRFAESAAAYVLGGIGPLFPNWLLNYKPIEAKRVGHFIAYKLAHPDEQGLQIWENSVFHRGYRVAKKAKESAFY